MDTDNPANVVKTAGRIEDSMAMIEHEFIEAIDKDIQLKETLETMRVNLAEQAPEGTIPDRKAWVDRHVRNSDDFAEWVTAHATRKKLETQFDLLSKRLTACQSVLKRLERESGRGFGHGQANV